VSTASVTALRGLGWGLLAGGALGLIGYASDSQPVPGAVSALSGIVCWATFTTAAAFVEHVSAKLESINRNTKRMADALEQGLR
jgi:hypothetical protein